MRIQSFFFLIATLLLCHSAVADDCVEHLKTCAFVEYVTCLSYPVERHVITTDDGHKLDFFRIQAKHTTISAGKPVVLMWSGMLDSADGWVINEEHIAPGFVLANKGYDIWLANSRGNKYSLDHISLDSKNSTQFWEFSWQQMSEYDLPAAFSYIAKLTKQKINYVAHSQGTIEMFAALANPAGKHPAITSNLRKFAALGPVSYLGNVKSPIFKGLAYTPLILELLTRVGKYGIFQPNWVSTQGGSLFCKTFSWSCSLAMSLISEEKPDQNSEDRYDYVAGHYPAGTSAMNLKHWIQLLRSGAFQMYDYGTKSNKKVYGQEKPPQYDPTLITEEVGLFVGTDDLIATSIDNAKFYRDMTNAKKILRYYPMGHLSFIIGKELTYMDDLLEFLDIKL